MPKSRNNKDIPDQQRGMLSYCSGLTLETAKKMLEAAEKEAKKLGLLMAIAIVDSGGNLVAFHRMDNSMLASVQISIDKAYTAVYGKVPSIVWGNEIRSGELPALFFHQRWIAFSGGFPLVLDGRIFGAVGASGAKKYGDASVARAAAVAGGFETGGFDVVLKSEGSKSETRRS